MLPLRTLPVLGYGQILGTPCTPLSGHSGHHRLVSDPWLNLPVVLALLGFIPDAPRFHPGYLDFTESSVCRFALLDERVCHTAIVADAT
ncbi:hypothetical protein SEA_OCTOBIEN14_123 [Gordonia phage Octobien14]|uniref:Uncharacterized protein n=1 Tax=Gordonia phage Octobien14 TaxID=2483673 RepID=A0A3G3MBF0_9CAUD|nr:hypothetical protein L3Y22_gp121 [Gordonia phage Octobien14]AYR03284.1 hypothetical protein SEA_OCTOBIEN14_123 [Gordonia phage Octobien14]